MRTANLLGEIVIVAAEDTAGETLRNSLRARRFGVFGPLDVRRAELAIRHAEYFDAAIVDVDTGEAAYEFVWQLNEADKPCRSIILGTRMDRAVLREAFLTGVQACFRKPVDAATLAAATRRTIEATSMMRTCLAAIDGTNERVATPEGGSCDRPALTPRETEILEFLLAGRSTKRIAEQLGVSARTVKFHVSNLLRKLGVESRLELLAKLRQDAAL